MRMYGTLHKVILEDSTEFITVNLPGTFDMFFPYGRPNDEYLIQQNVVISNPEIISLFEENQIVYGDNQVRNDYQNNMKVINTFLIERFLTLEQYENLE